MALVQLPQVRMGHDEHIVPLTYDHLARINLKEENKDFANVIPNYINYVWDHAVDGMSWAGYRERQGCLCVWHSAILGWRC